MPRRWDDEGGTGSDGPATASAPGLIPAEKMKMRDDHEVPLSRQALAILAELRPLTGRGGYLFSHDDDVPMSDNMINKALRIMDYDTGPGGDHCAHGFRSA